MTYNDLPALFKHADSAATIHQSRYLRSLFIQYLALLVASTATIGNGLIAQTPAISVYLVALSVAIAAQIWMAIKKPDRKWYRARALAESVKTLSWKFAMFADPFHTPPTNSMLPKVLRERIEVLLAPHRIDPTIFDAGEEYGEVVTPSMLAVQKLSLTEKIQLYREHRVRDQLNWYVNKSQKNRKRSYYFSLVVIVVYVAAAAFGLLQLLDPSTEFTWISEPILLLASALIGWTQAKRFGELAASYSLTAHEVSSLLTMLTDDMSVTEFQELVSEAEFAFSREHTQWAARA